MTAPVGSPPLGAHVPGMYSGGVISLLPIAMPGSATFVHCSSSENDEIGSS
ncbi:hypothetical protein [Polyangium mundeleinium]|uniref:Uncharacterized protein n=1 Tax=Polyangium mundeleinium TaxID=2995306 RepID=A0ABT5F7G2_9BACT|nr:hypothetical protein [Polyangium mundeleinium]MDC0750050.1 hypothetical protein [Polyangium mundeleinium]